MEVQLSGKQILITGGTSALGQAFVKRAREEGAQIFFTYHKDESCAKQLETLGARGFQIDLGNRRAIDELKKKISEHTRQLDAIIHNAAVVRDRTIQNMSEEEWDEALSLDLTAVYYLTKKFLSFLFKKPSPRVIAPTKERGGRNDAPRKILNLVSRVGLHGSFGEANYAAAKGGVIALTKTLAQELGKKQILVNALNPGFMKSKMTAGVPPEVFERNIRESMLGQISEPEHVADFMIYLLSDRFQGVTGQIFHLDSRRT